MKKNDLEHQMTVDFILYPGIKNELKERIELILKETERPLSPGGKQVKAILAPHAGWSQCDRIMASAYGSVANRDIERVIILSRVHREPARSIFLPEFLTYITPLGKLNVDEKITIELSESNRIFTFNNVPHVEEHSIEVQLPFIKYLWPEAKIVPILTGKSSVSISRKLSESLHTVLENKMDKTLFVISSSFSTYETGHKSKIESDHFISLLNNHDEWKTLPEKLANGDIGACSADCLASVLKIQGIGNSVDILNLKKWENLEEKEKRVCFGAISIS